MLRFYKFQKAKAWFWFTLAPIIAGLYLLVELTNNANSTDYGLIFTMVGMGLGGSVGLVQTLIWYRGGLQPFQLLIWFLSSVVGFSLMFGLLGFSINTLGPNQLDLMLLLFLVPAFFYGLITALPLEQYLRLVYLAKNGAKL